MTDYQLSSTVSIIRTSDSAFIPPDPANADYRAYMVWCAAGNVASAYMPPAALVPDAISDRQFFQQLAMQGVISQAEALAAVKTGDIPTSLLQLIDALPEAQQFGATMIVAGATTFERHHPITLVIGQAYGWSSDQIDALWRAAAAL